MTEISIHRTRTQFAEATASLRRAVQFRAWRVHLAEAGNPRHEARPVPLPDWIETAEDAAKVACSVLMHRGSVMVLRSDAAEREERRNLLTVFQVRRRSKPAWIRGADGKTVRAPDEYPEFVMQVHVGDGFEPVEPIDALRDPVGLDLQLVEN